MSAEILHEMNGLLAEQVDAFAAVLEQRDLARDVAVQLEQECTELRSILATIGQVRAEGMRCTCGPLASQPCAAEWLDILLGDAARVGAMEES